MWIAGYLIVGLLWASWVAVTHGPFGVSESSVPRFIQSTLLWPEEIVVSLVMAMAAGSPGGD